MRHRYRHLLVWSRSCNRGLTQVLLHRIRSTFRAFTSPESAHEKSYVQPACCAFNQPANCKVQGNTASEKVQGSGENGEGTALAGEAGGVRRGAAVIRNLKAEKEEFIPDTCFFACIPAVGEDPPEELQSSPPPTLSVPTNYILNFLAQVIGDGAALGQ
jgi:hypothetical protein